MEEILYSIALRSCPLIGDINFRKIVDAAGSAKDAWEISKNHLHQIEGIGKKISKEIGQDKYLKFAEKELDFCIKNNISVFLNHLDQLPASLGYCNDAPSILYMKGNWKTEKKPLSIVGTRNMTAYGRKTIEELLLLLKDRNIISISGLALGTDACVHETSLLNHIPTCGVLAHGFQIMYPSKHKKLAQQILDKGGCLFTEFPSNEKPERENFIQRNRIIAGLSKVTIVIETAYGGGSISTVNYANHYNREVFANPGRIFDKYSQGCNLLISQNKARILNDFQEVITELGYKNEIASLFDTKEIPKTLNEDQRIIFEIIEKNENINLDDLIDKSNISTHKIHTILLELEINGYIRTFSGRQYSIIP